MKFCEIGRYGKYGEDGDFPVVSVMKIAGGGEGGVFSLFAAVERVRVDVTRIDVMMGKLVPGGKFTGFRMQPRAGSRQGWDA